LTAGLFLDVNEITVINQTVVAEGTFVTDQLDEQLTEPTDKTFGVAHEQTGTVREYDRYERAEVPAEVENAPAVAVADETVVVSPDIDRLGAGDLVVGRLGPLPSDQLTEDGQTIEPDPQFEPRSGEDMIATVEAVADGGDAPSTDVDSLREFVAASRTLFTTGFLAVFVLVLCNGLLAVGIGGQYVGGRLTDAIVPERGLAVMLAALATIAVLFIPAAETLPTLLGISVALGASFAGAALTYGSSTALFLRLVSEL
jgi:hypothetical protein